MKYRVILEVGYCDAYFDFDDVEAACSFATTVLLHQSESDYTKKKKSVRMEIINTEIKEEVESD